MSFFITDAFAQAPAEGQADPTFSFILMIGLFALIWFIALRPQQKRMKEHKKMVEALAKGDEVVTNGGLLGRINKLDNNFVTLEIASGIEVKVQRQAVSTLMPKGTISQEGGQKKETKPAKSKDQ